MTYPALLAAVKLNIDDLTVMFPVRNQVGGMVPHATSIELDAYFSRIAYGGSREPTLATLHAITAAHAAAIPFENLDILLGS